MATMTQGSRDARPPKAGEASLIVGAYWNERRKVWDVIATVKGQPGRPVTRSVIADTTVAISDNMAGDAADAIRRWLESLLF